MTKRQTMLNLLDVLEEENEDNLLSYMYLPVQADAMVMSTGDDFYLLEHESFVPIPVKDFIDILREQINNASSKQVNEYYRWWDAALNL